MSKNTTSKASEEKKEKESFESSDESSSKKETSKQNEAPVQKKVDASASNKETSNKTAVTKSESAQMCIRDRFLDVVITDWKIVLFFILTVFIKR